MNTPPDVAVAQPPGPAQLGGRRRSGGERVRGTASAAAPLASDPRAGGGLSAVGHRPGRVAARSACRPPPSGR